jgi:hypothetical protein
MPYTFITLNDPQDPTETYAVGGGTEGLSTAAFGGDPPQQSLLTIQQHA